MIKFSGVRSSCAIITRRCALAVAPSDPGGSAGSPQTWSLADARSSTHDRIEVIEGLYGGLMLIHAARTAGQWSMVAEWDDGRTADIYRFDPIPGSN